MTALLRLCYLLALSVWIGEVVFFSFVAAPAIFSVLGPAPAGEVVSAIFPRYYAIGIGAATVTLVSAVGLGRRAALPRLWTATAVVVALGLVATVIAGTVVHPRAQRLRAAAHAGAPRGGHGARAVGRRSTRIGQTTCRRPIVASFSISSGR